MPISIVNNNTNRHERYSGIYHLSTAPWWLPSGISESSVIAAYQFKNAQSENHSLMNLANNSTYALTKTGSDVVWSANGMFIAGGTHLIGMNAQNFPVFTSCAVRYSGVDIQNPNTVGLASAYEGYKIFARASHYNGKNLAKIGVKKGGKQTPLYLYDIVRSNAVLIVDMASDQINVDGVEIGLESSPTFVNATYDTQNTIGQTYQSVQQSDRSGIVWGSVTIQAVVFYNISLTMGNKIELYNAMNNL